MQCANKHSQQPHHPDLHAEEAQHPPEEETGLEDTDPEDPDREEEEEDSDPEEEEGNGREEEAGTWELCITDSTQNHRLPIG